MNKTNRGCSFSPTHTHWLVPLVGLGLIAACNGSVSEPPQDARASDSAIQSDSIVSHDAVAADSRTNDSGAPRDASTPPHDATDVQQPTHDAAVGACNALPPPGTWDSLSISPVVSTSQVSYEWNGDSVAVVVDPFDTATVWLGTGMSGLFKSTDCGATWTKVNTGINGAALDQSVLWSFVIDPVTQGTIYTVGAYGAEGLWKSTNGGVDWTSILPPDPQFEPSNFVNNISMDPTNHLHLGLQSHGLCNRFDPLGCIRETFDGGQTWSNLIATPAPWGEKGGLQVVNATTLIWGGGDQGSGMYVSTNNGASWMHALPGGAGDVRGETCTQPLERASDGAYYIPSSEGVVRSTDGVNWTLAWGQQDFHSAPVSAVVVTATTIYGVDNQNYFSAPLSDYSHWSAFQGPTGLRSDAFAGFIASDESHHLLYVSTWQGGLYRYVTP